MVCERGTKMLSQLALIAILVLASLLTPSTSQGDNTALPLTFPARVTHTLEQTCPSDELREMVRDEIDQDV